MHSIASGIRGINGVTMLTSKSFAQYSKINATAFRQTSPSKLARLQAMQQDVRPMQPSMLQRSFMGINKVNSPRQSSIFSLSTPIRCFGAETIKVPGMGDSISEGTIEEFVKHPGEFVEADEIIARIETDKVTVDITAPKSGVIEKYLYAEGDTVDVGADFYVLDPDAKGGSAPAQAAPKAEPAAQAPPKAAPEPARAAPEPPKAAAAPPPPPPPVTPQKAPAAASGGGPASTTAKKAPTTISGQRLETRVPMSRMRIKIAENLKHAQNTNALLTTFNEVDMSGYINLRKVYGEQFLKKHNIKLGFMSGFLKASTMALKDQPVVNAAIEGQDIVYRDFVDISVAVSTPKGLAVPVLRNTQDMEMLHLEKELAELGMKARDGKITLEDMAGGTFTVTNGGVFGSMLSTPLVNPPQSAILGMHATKLRPVVVGGKIEARPIMYVALTYDHRIIDGREAVTFLKQIKELVEDPQRMLLEC